MIPGDLINDIISDYQHFLIPFKSDLLYTGEEVNRTIIQTANVVDNILILAKSIDLNDNEKDMVNIIGLYHNIGKLWTILPENADLKNEDHAEASIAYLISNQIFLRLEESMQNIILKVIGNHNKPELSKKDGEAVLFYCKLLRDAVKLENWRMITENLVRKGGKPTFVAEHSLSLKPVVTAAVVNTVLEGNIPDKKSLVTLNDFLIFQMALVFELYHQKSFQLLNNKQYIRHLYDPLPKNDQIIEIYRMMRIFIENKI